MKIFKKKEISPKLLGDSEFDKKSSRPEYLGMRATANPITATSVRQAEFSHTVSSAEIAPIMCLRANEDIEALDYVNLNPLNGNVYRATSSSSVYGIATEGGKEGDIIRIQLT